jgi:hypothetical protein
MSTFRLDRNQNGLKHTLGNTLSFIEYQDSGQKLRGFAAGFISGNDYICCNLNKLSKFLGCCKSKISSYFLENHIITLPRTESDPILSKNFDICGSFPFEHRQWSVRIIDPAYKNSLTTNVPQTEIGSNFVQITYNLFSNPNLPELISQLEMLPAEVICPNCNTQMVQRHSEKSQLDFYWRCTKCPETQPGTFQTIFQNTRSNAIYLLLSLYCFSRDYSLDETILQTGLDKKTIVEIFTELRLIIHSIDTDPTKQKLIGGQNMNVQIDETYISKRKYNTGRLCCSYWVVGGVCEENNEIFLTFTKKRTKTRLQQIINCNVSAGTHIKTDSWPAYNFLDQPPYPQKYTHSKVNHKIQFVANDGTHTQNIERLWGEFKMMKRRRRGFKIQSMGIYLSEFKWRRMIKMNNEDPFRKVLEICRTLI